MAINSNQRDIQSSLKEALYETLNGILSHDRDTRQAAEHRIQALEVTDDFGIHLTEFVVDTNGALAIRQLSSVLLKQYVETHWSSLAQKFRPPEIKLTTKEKIKELLPLGLHESISKVRASVAYAISAIAHWDWPENWPGLFDILVNCLSGHSEFAVHGAMRVLSEFTRDLSDTNLPNVGPVILQEMYRIFQSESQYSIRTRGRAVEIFTTIATLVASTGLYQKGYIEQYLQPVIPLFCEKFVTCLREPNGPRSDIGLKTEIAKAITCLILKLPKYVANYLPQILPPIWDTLTHSAKIYQEENVNGAEETEDKGVDSDGELINFNNLIIAIFDIIHSLIDHKRFSNLLNSLQREAMYYAIIFMQITDEQIELWTANPSQFMEEDEQCAYAYNVRISAQELLTALINHMDANSVNALCEVITTHIEAANTQRASRTIHNTDEDNTWKLCESAVLALSLAKDDMIETMDAGNLHFDFGAFLNTVILGILNNPTAHPFLLGRCLCLGGRYARKIPPEMSSRFLEATVNGLQENQPMCIRISSVRAVYWYCEASTTANTAIDGIVRSHLPAIFQGIFALANQPSTEVLTLVMETFSILVGLDKEFTASVESKICPLTIAVFVKFHSDPEILSLCQDIFKELTENPQCIGPLQTRLVPTLISMMMINPAKSDEEGSRSVALDVLQVLVQYSPRTLSSALVETAFPAACNCVINSDDNATLQSGGELIRSYLSVGARQIIDHRDNEGRTGLHYVLQIIAQLLNPQSSEFTAAFVGRLMTTLIRKVGSNLGENLDLLLKAVLSKMQRAETLTVMQSLLMVYAHLINTEFDAVLNFLSTVPGPTGQSALAFVLVEWVNRQQLFFGSYDKKVTIVALCKILEHGVTHDDSRLNEITIRGEQIFSGDEDRVRTRSKTQTQPYVWTTIPILVKIFKLIINELGNDIEARCVGRSQEEEGSDEDDDDEGAWVDPGEEGDMIRVMGDDEDDDDGKEDDPDLMQDSIYHLNLNQYLRDFLTNFSNHHCFPAFIQHLNAAERKILTTLNINPTYI